MNEVKNSITLEKILQQAEQLNPSPKRIRTLECFLLVLVHIFENSNQMDMELIYAKKIFHDHQLDIGITKKVLNEYVYRDSGSTYDDEIRFKLAFYLAADTAKTAGASELTVNCLLKCILECPEEAIGRAIKLSKGEKVGKWSWEHSEKKSDESNPNSKKSAGDLVKEMNGLSQKEIDKVVDDVISGIQDDEEKDIRFLRNKEAMDLLVTNVKQIRNQLLKFIFGQDNAVNQFVTGYFQANLLSVTDGERKRPKATFLFAGPPGVGKTFLAENVAQALKLPFRRFDMSEYADKEAHLEFCGSDKVYKNGKPGNVTGFVEKNTECVLLFDEIEKAHINVIHLFLQMLDAGRLRDNYTDEEVSFTNTIIILTTNAGRQLYEKSESGDFSSVSRKVIIKALQTDVKPENGVPYFPTALCSRFASGNVVMFNRITAHNLRDIAKREIQRQALNLENETGIKMQIDDRVYTALLFAEGSNADARTVRSRAENFFNDELYELLRLISSEKVKSKISALEKISVTVELTGSSEKISALFESGGNFEVLVLADDDIAQLCMKKAECCKVLGTKTLQRAKNFIKNNNIGFALVDICCGQARQDILSLNIEDVDSEARKFLKYLRETQADIPIYLLENDTYKLSDEEKATFKRQGVRGFLSPTNKNFSKQISEIVHTLYQQGNMLQLAKENKLVSFETAQTISKSGKSAKIKLFDFSMAVAVDSEDTKDILSSVSMPDIKFDDVIGADDAKKELTYFVEYLKNPKKYTDTGVKAPRGVLLYGSPGTGKTMLAKAMASEAGVTFINAEGNQFLQKYLGDGSRKVHELFRTARKYAPAILFVDEIDAIAKERKGLSVNGGGNEETLTAFLTEMDGFANDPTKPVFVLAATNFDVEPGGDKSLDPALMRRFDRRVYIDLPNKNDRIKFIQKKIHKNKALKISAQQVENIALRATGMSLSSLDSVIELSLRSAIREGSTIVTDAIFEEAFETFHSGDVKKWDVSQLERVARHEAGHALISYLGGEKPSYLTIVARGNHGGYMQTAEQEGKAIYTRDELLLSIRTALGGRASELVYYGDPNGVSTGAGGDLISATDLAQKMICAYGMNDAFGLAVVREAELVNGVLSSEIRNTVNKILQEQLGEAVRLISEHKVCIDALVEQLLEKNHLNGEDIENILAKNVSAKE